MIIPGQFSEGIHRRFLEGIQKVFYKRVCKLISRVISRKLLNFPRKSSRISSAVNSSRAILECFQNFFVHSFENSAGFITRIIPRCSLETLQEFVITCRSFPELNSGLYKKSEIFQNFLQNLVLGTPGSFSKNS